MARFDSEFDPNLHASTVSGVSPAAGREDSRFTCLTILWHADPERVGERAILVDLAVGLEAPLSRLTPIFSQPQGGPKRPLADPHLSRDPVRLVPGSDGGLQVLEARSDVSFRSKGRGAAGGFEFSAAEIDDGVVLEVSGRIVLLLHSIHPNDPPAPRFGLVGESDAIRRLRREIAAVADLDVPVLLRGETGTGKELVAHAIHEASRRHRASCLSVNVGGIPSSLAAAELFGAARGSFTGADRHREGYFAQADRGTLFLDEIGECPGDVQVLLLRALESGDIQPVGAAELRRVDVRVIAATDADLEDAVASGEFRGPLLHRLGGYAIHLPPLRRRRDDIGRLLLHFLRGELDEIGQTHALRPTPPGEAPWLPARLVARMVACDWPGNVRQLRNFVRQAVIGQRGIGRVIEDDRIETLLTQAAAAVAVAGPDREEAKTRRTKTSYRQPSEVGEDELREALEANDWQLKATAAALHVARSSLYTLIERHPDLRTAARLGRKELERALAEHRGSLGAAAAALEVSVPALRRRASDLGLL